MKHLRLIPLLFILGCANVTHIPGYEVLWGVDLRPYAERGFLITPYPYQGQFTTLAIIDYKIMPGAELKAVKPGDPAYTRYYSTAWVKDTVDMSEALENVYSLCMDMGAYCLMDFKIVNAEDVYSVIQRPVTIECYRITGIAITRDDL